MPYHRPKMKAAKTGSFRPALVACSNCKAKARKPCVRGDGKSLRYSDGQPKFHKARVKAWNRSQKGC